MGVTESISLEIASGESRNICFYPVLLPTFFNRSCLFQLEVFRECFILRCPENGACYKFSTSPKALWNNKKPGEAFRRALKNLKTIRVYILHLLSGKDKKTNHPSGVFLDSYQVRYFSARSPDIIFSLLERRHAVKLTRVDRLIKNFPLASIHHQPIIAPMSKPSYVFQVNYYFLLSHRCDLFTGTGTEYLIAAISLANLKTILRDRLHLNM